jgi:hypothetical protein
MKSILLGVTYSEFDNTVGPQLLYTYPLEVMTKERFEEVGHDSEICTSCPVFDQTNILPPLDFICSSPTMLSLVLIYARKLLSSRMTTSST